MWFHYNWICDCWCGLSLPPSVALLLWRDLGRTALIWQQLQWDPTLCIGHTFCSRKRAVLQKSNVSFCGITCSLLSPCSPVLWCWEPFCGLWVGLWSLASDFLGTKDLLQGSQWGALDSVMPVYCLMLPLKKCGKPYPLLSRINLTAIKVNGKFTVYLSGNKIRSRVARIRAWSRKRHWKLRRWLWLHGHFSIVLLTETALQPLVLALFFTLTPEFVHGAKLLFWVENKEF